MVVHRRMSRRRVGRNHKHRHYREPTFCWLIAAAIGLALVLIGVGSWLATAGLQRRWISETLTWPREQVLASPENTQQFIEARLTWLADQLPADMIHPSFAPIPSKTMLRRFLDCREMDLALNDILAGQRIVKEGQDYRLTYLGDIHYNPLFDLQSQRSKDRQRWIAATLRAHPQRLLFVEGATGELNWEALFRTEQKLCQDRKTPGPQSVGHYRTVVLANSRVWWEQFLDVPTVALYGVDQPKMCQVLMMMNSIQLGDPALQKIWQDTFYLLAIIYRDQAVLGRCLQEMARRQIRQAAIVLGEGHTPTFTTLCQYWGVETQIIELPR